MQDFENQTTDEKIMEYRQKIVSQEEVAIGVKKETDLLEAQIQKEINEEVGYGVWISYSEQDKIKKKVRNKYKNEILRVKLSNTN